MTSDTATPIHTAACDIWQVTDGSAPDALLQAGYKNESTVAYLSRVSPIYAALSRVLAQFSGVLLLAMTDQRTVLGLDRAAWVTARDQLHEAHARLREISAPSACTRHYGALGQIASGLKRAATALDTVAALPDPHRRRAGIADVFITLKRIQKLLIATAEPDANIAPVDFNGGCCNCGAQSAAAESPPQPGVHHG